MRIKEEGSRNLIFAILKSDVRSSVPGATSQLILQSRSEDVQPGYIAGEDKIFIISNLLIEKHRRVFDGDKRGIFPREECFSQPQVARRRSKPAQEEYHKAYQMRFMAQKF